MYVNPSMIIIDNNNTYYSLDVVPFELLSTVEQLIATAGLWSLASSTTGLLWGRACELRRFPQMAYLWHCIHMYTYVYIYLLWYYDTILLILYYIVLVIVFVIISILICLYGTVVVILEVDVWIYSQDHYWLAAFFSLGRFAYFDWSHLAWRTWHHVETWQINDLHQPLENRRRQNSNTIMPLSDLQMDNVNWLVVWNIFYFPIYWE